jgi:hypothetical protein
MMVTVMMVIMTMMMTMVMAAMIMVGVAVTIPSTSYGCKFLLIEFFYNRQCCVLIFWFYYKKFVAVKGKTHLFILLLAVPDIYVQAIKKHC